MVRPAMRADAAALADIHISSWQGTYRGVFPDEYLDELDREGRTLWFAKRLRDGESILIEPDEAPQGFSWFGDPFAEEEDEGWAELYSIYVLPEAWGKGHGFRLLKAVETSASEIGYQRMFLWVLDRNERARRFYERQGWSLASQLKLEEIAGVQITEVRYEIDLPPA